MFAMFSQLFAAIASFFSAAEKLGSAANHLGTWADESAGAFADEARIQRTQKRMLLDSDTNRLAIAVNVPAPPVTAPVAPTVTAVQ